MVTANRQRRQVKLGDRGWEEKTRETMIEWISPDKAMATLSRTVCLQRHTIEVSNVYL